MFSSNLTVEEIKERLADQLDEVDLLELLQLTSYDLVNRFADIIEQDIDKYRAAVEEGDGLYGNEQGFQEESN